MARGKAITGAEYRALAGFRYALRQFLRFSEEAARRAGLEPQQHQALLAIRGFSGAGAFTVGDLAERLQVRHHSAVGLVDRLATVGLVRREPSSQDRRRVHVELTARGRATLARVAGAHRSELQRIGPRLGRFLRAVLGARPALRGRPVRKSRS